MPGSMAPPDFLPAVQMDVWSFSSDVGRTKDGSKFLLGGFKSSFVVVMGADRFGDDGAGDAASLE